MIKWTPPLVFEGQTVFIVGGGASLKGFDWSRLDGKRVVACNVAAYVVPFADAVVFADRRFFERHRNLITDFRGLVVTTSKAAAESMPAKIKLVVPKLHDTLRPGPSSGHLGAWLAIEAGAKRVVLLGMDGARLRDGRSHFHDLYNETLSHWGCGRLIAGWHGWRKECELRGIEVFNASPISAVDEFKRVDIDAVLGDRIL